MAGRRLALRILFTFALCAGAVDARAQLPADARWSTIESRNFRVSFEAQLEPLARHAAASAERAHAALRYMISNPPAGKIDIVVADNVDFSNGYATPIPSNRIVVYAKTPIDALELQYTRDWIELVITHELAHIFHTDVTGAFGRVVRAIFGRVPAPWPIFPVLGTPLWSLEGLAVGIESHVAGLGRLHGSYHEMIARTAVLEDEIDDIHRLNSSSPVWPGSTRVYIYGSLFMDYIARRYGPDAIPRLVRATASTIIPPPLWFGNVADHTIGVTFQEAYTQWTQELEQRYTALAAQLSASGLTESTRLSTHGRIALYPRFSPDSRRIAYTSSDGRSNPRTTVIDAETGAAMWTSTRNDVAVAAWASDTALVAADLQYTDRFHIYSDLYHVRRGDRDRLTRNARLQEPDIARDGRRVIAVENAHGTNRLVLVDAATGEQRALGDFDPHVQWSLPRWAPDGQRIAVSRWQTGGRYDVVVIDTLGAVQLVVSDTVGINTGAAWSPDGQWLLFASDRTGISNLYGADLAVVSNDSANSGIRHAPRLRQITNLLTGAFYPDVSTDGRFIVFSAYHHDGFSIERMPFDPNSWREPQHALLTDLAAQRTIYATQIRANEFNTAVSAAAARADTMSGPVRGYRAAAHLRPYFWLPILEVHAGDDYFGLYSSGNDLVQRHGWSGNLAVAPSSGRTIGAFSYAYRGLPSFSSLQLHPTLSLAVDRFWDEIERDDSTGYHIDEREDRLFLTLGLSRPRWRSSTSLSLSGELVRRSRYLLHAPANLRLLDPDDELLGVRASGSVAAYSTPALAISPQNGFVLQLSGRDRFDRSPRTVQTTQGTRTFDASYRELTTWNAGYLALPTSGFARQVIAARFSALLRSGPGASTTGIGGPSGQGFNIGDLVGNIGGSARLLPVRGFTSDARRGTRAWTASLEQRVPLALVTRSLSPLPIFVDRLAASFFADAGHAWCDDDDATRFRVCRSTSPTDAPLISAGAELATFVSFWGAPVPLRLGAGVPLQGGNGLRFHLVAGIAF